MRILQAPHVGRALLATNLDDLQPSLADSREIKHGPASDRRNVTAVSSFANTKCSTRLHDASIHEQLTSELVLKVTAAFWTRAQQYFADQGITIKRVLIDNGSCYRSKLFAETLGPDVAHKRARPYRPQTNGKVERFNRTLNQEWAYAQTFLTDEARAATYQSWVHLYNHHRPHTGIGGKSPIERLGVHNLPVKNS